MSASRECFDIFSKYGRKNFFRPGMFGDKWARHYVIKDTFGHHLCFIAGHSKNVFVSDEGEKICRRCYRRAK